MDRFDICDAFYVFATLWHGGQGSREYAYFGRLAKLGYKPGHSVQHCKLESPGARAVYRELCKARGY